MNLNFLKNLLLGFCLFLLMSCGANKQEKNQAGKPAVPIANNDPKELIEAKQECDSSWQAAEKDLQKHSLKYYYAGITNADGNTSKFLKEKCEIEIVNQGCNMVGAYTCYNNFAEKIIKEKTGKTILQILHE